MIEFKGNGEFIDGRCGIYAVINPIGEIYVGASRDIELRIRNYKKSFHASGKLKISLFKFGRQSHKYYLLEELPENVSEVEMIEKEKYYISELKKEGKELLNSNGGGGGQSVKAKIKKSAKMLDNWALNILPESRRPV